MSPADTPAATFDHDVVIVGGGPAGCSAGVFTAREGLDTVIYDCGRSSLKRCAHLENYLGFPAGIDIETMYDLIQDHAETAGCTFVSDLVESLEPIDGGFVVDPQENVSVTARRVVAATRYDGEYMRGLDDDAVLFETYEHEGEQHETFDGSYADHDGTTPIDGLYIATPADVEDTQAIVAAGRGARVGRRVVGDVHIDEGWWPERADSVDWVRREAELDGEWTDRQRWIEWFDDSYADEAPVPTDSERYRRVRGAYVDELLDSHISPAEMESRAEEGHRELAAHLDAAVVAETLDPETVVESLGSEALLDALDDDAILDAVSDEQIHSYAQSMEQKTP
jgi:hypothetical protein